MLRIEELKKKKKERKNDAVPLKSYAASQVIFRFGARNEKQHCGNIQ